MSVLYTLSARSLEGETIALERYRDKVLLIVNTASECGFTRQYAGLQALYQQYATRGFTVLGFPCNQFGQQEPGSAQQIADFCEARYHVTFPMFEKIDVKGANAHPLFRYLTAQAPGLFGTKAIKWNFTKFLINRKGEGVQRYAPTKKPHTLEEKIEAMLFPEGK